MTSFLELKDKIAILSVGEYRYDRLVSEFADHFLALKERSYSPLPDLAVFDAWLSHLQCELRPALLSAEEEMAAIFGFSLGDQVRAKGVTLYVTQVACYPLEMIVRLRGLGVKKDGKPSATGTFVEVDESVGVQKLKGILDRAQIEAMRSQGSSREESVRSFINSAIAKLPQS